MTAPVSEWATDQSFANKCGAKQRVFDQYK